MADRNRAKPSRRSAGAIRLAALAAVFAITACTQVKETASEASDRIDQWLGTESTAEPAAAEAAERLHEDAQFTYGVVQAAGLGAPRNPVAGHAWLSLAAAQGHAQAKKVAAALAKKMTPRQIQKAESRAAGFRPGPSEVFADRPALMYVQQSLNVLGFDAGPVDGVAGPRTQSAIREFESGAKFAGNGEVSPELLRGLLAKQNRPE